MEKKFEKKLKYDQFNLVIPCYNEGQNIEKLFNKIEGLLNRSSNIEIIIVDNGSTDNTEINVLKFKTLQGK